MTAPTATVRPARRPLSLHRQRQRTAVLMVIPAVVLVGALVFYPLARGAWISLHQWDGLSGSMTWFGLRNFQNVANDAVFTKALGNTFVYALGVTVVKNVLGLGIALLLNQALRGRGLFRTATFVPVMMSYVAVGILWSWIFNPTFGLLNAFLEAVGLGGLIQGWLSDPTIALYSVMAVDVWKWTGFHVVIFLAGLQTVPPELLEAASLDGAGRVQSFVRVTLPLLVPVLSFSILMSLTGAFVANYDLVTVMTGGGPSHSTEVALTWIVNTAFQHFNVGKANAMSIVLFALVAVIGAVQVRIMARATGGGR